MADGSLWRVNEWQMVDFDTIGLHFLKDQLRKKTQCGAVIPEKRHRQGIHSPTISPQSHSGYPDKYQKSL